MGRISVTRWESGARQPSLSDLQTAVRAAGFDLSMGLTELDDSWDPLVADQLALSPFNRLVNLLPLDEVDDLVNATSWLARAHAETIVIGGVGAALQGGPQRPADGGVLVVAQDPTRLTDEMHRQSLVARDADSRWAASDRRWPWALPDGGAIVLATAMTGAPRDYRAFRRSARWVTLTPGSDDRVRVAH